jgi:hypothetical protein
LHYAQIAIASFEIACILNCIEHLDEHHFPCSLDAIAAYEERFSNMISRNRINIGDVTKKVTPLNIECNDARLQAMQHQYSLPITLHEGWTLPDGAFAKTGCGPV